MEKSRILVTSALPYANGPIHLGHILEYTQTDVWVRFQRLMGKKCIYLCADDTHGTTLMIRARKEGRSEIEIISESNAAHQKDFAGFQIGVDHYGSTNSESNRALCHEIWAALRKGGYVVEREVTQLFDAKLGIFLADRFVKGTCPNCSTPNQYGDSCDNCGATYSATDLKDAISTQSGTVPEIRSAQHLFVTIERLHDFLTEWTQSADHLQPGVANYLKGHFLGDPLRDWDVSRPAPYFGFEIPDAPGNYWYVWFDAPIGYMAATKEWCDREGELFDDWWRSSETDIVHVIGKDITYFHALFWPAMLKASGFSLPRRIQVHGFVTVNGEKMSKSKGTFIEAATYLEHLDPAYLRYFYASKLTPKVDDLDLDLNEFAQKVNSDLVGKVVNLASRTARFVQETGLAEEYPDDEGLFAHAAAAGSEIAEAYAAWDFSRATRLIMALADRANEYVDRKQPWALKKQPGQEKSLVDVCTVALNLYRQLAIYLAPILPKLAEQTGELFGSRITGWALASRPLVGTRIAPFKHLMQRVDPKKVEQMIEAGKKPEPEEPRPALSASDDGSALLEEPLAPECSIDDFGKVDLRVARVLSAEPVAEAKKLLKLTVSLGGTERRTVFAGIKAAYEADALVGRLVVVVANLKPRKMKFGTSEAMVVAVGPGGSDVFLLSPDAGAKVGQRVH